MKYCPKCRGEFEDWVEKCVDCQVELVDAQLPTSDLKNTKLEPKAPQDPLVVIAIYSTAVDANLGKEILESEGIDEVVVHEIEPTSNWILPPTTTGGVHLLVRESDAGVAIETIKSITDIVPIAYADIYDGDEEEDEENCAE
jgi:hypothetical protein